jgi:hypothetical protein
VELSLWLQQPGDGTGDGTFGMITEPHKEFRQFRTFSSSSGVSSTINSLILFI